MQWKRYTQTILAGVLGLALLVGLNVLAAKQNWRWDTTTVKRNSLAPETIHTLTTLKRPVKAVAFYRPEEGRAQLQDLFKLFERYADQFSFEFVDPDRSPFKAKELKVTATGTVVLVSGDKQEQLALPNEQKLLNGLIRVTNLRRAKLYFSTGHGESDPQGDGKDSCTHLGMALTEQGADVQKIMLAQQDSMPGDADALFILGPRMDFADQELKVLSDYLQRGGRLFIAISAEDNINLDGWLNNIGLERLDGMAVDPLSKLLVGDAMAPIIQEYNTTPITDNFALMTVFPTATALAAVVKGDGPAPVQWLGRSNPQSWLETDLETLRNGSAEFVPGSDVQGPLWLVAAFEKRMEKGGDKDAGKADESAGKDTEKAPLARAVVFADQDFLTDQFVNSYGNMDLARNSANWLMEREQLITVTKPEAANVLLVLSVGERILISWVPLLLIPLACLMLALIVTVSRRRVK